MVPLAEYASVSEDATLFEAIMALDEAQNKVPPLQDKHRAILVLDRNGQLAGKLTQWDVSAGIEPGYRSVEAITEKSISGLSSEYLRTMMQDYGLWRKPLEDLCRKASEIRVRDIMSKPEAGEYIDEESSMNEAIHLLVMGRHMSLIVKKGDAVTGILRMSDVFKNICHQVKACKI